MCTPGPVSTVAGLFLLPQPNFIMTTLPIVLIIDPDREMAAELTRLLHSAGLARVIATASSVSAAAGGLFLRGEPSIDCLFIRIGEWDAFLQHRKAFPEGRLTIVFLSGRQEKCTRHLTSEVDFHLQPPIKLSHLAAIFRQTRRPDFQPRPLDFLFLKVLCRYHVLRFDDIVEVRAKNGLLTIVLTEREYTVPGSLNQFENRLPVPSERVRRGILVIHHGKTLRIH
jgi:DNA-binding LytR/AlgR family response regulator